MTNLLTEALKRTDEAASAYNRWIYNQISPFLGSKILEVGCGIGNITRLLVEGGERLVVASDLEADYLSTLEHKSEDWKNKPKTVNLDIASSIPSWLREYEFDTIVCLNVLEHIQDDLKALRNIYESLRPGGKLVLLVPAWPWLYNSLDYSLAHQRRYTPKELKQKIFKSGFKLIKCSNFNLFGILGWWMDGHIFKREVVRTRELSLFDFFVPWLQRLERVIPPPIGLSLIYIAYRQGED